MKVKIPYVAFIVIAVLAMTIFSSWADAQLYFQPTTNQLVTSTLSNPENPSFLDVFWVYQKVNLWEWFLWSIGIMLGWVFKDRYVEFHVPL